MEVRQHAICINSAGNKIWDKTYGGTNSDKSCFYELLESAPFNVGKVKMHEEIASNLVAYACKISFQKGFDGYVAFTAK